MYALYRPYTGQTVLNMYWKSLRNYEGRSKCKFTRDTYIYIVYILTLLNASAMWIKQHYPSRKGVSKLSGRFSTSAVLARSQIRSCEICGRQSGTLVGFLLVLRFPLPILIPPTNKNSLIISLLTLYNFDDDSAVK
jgi:hypothetical protein